MAAQDPLTNLFTNQAQMRLAGAGGYGDKGTGPASVLRSILGVIGPAMASAFPRGPLPQAIGALNSTLNMRDYNRYLKDQALLERDRQIQENRNNAGIYQSATGQQVLVPSAGFDTGFASSQIPHIRQSNQVGNYNAALQGQPLQFDPYGEFNQQIYQSEQDRQAALADAQATNTRMMPQVQAGQKASGVNLLLNRKFGPLSGVLPTDNNGLDMSELQPGALAAGITQQAVNPPTVSPYQVGIVDPKLMLDATGMGLKDTQELGGQTETKRSHQANEKIDQQRADASTTSAQADMIRAKKYQPGGGGGSQNPYTIPNSQQNFIQGQIDALDKELKTLGYVGTDGKIKDVPQDSQPGWFGMGGHTRTPKEQRAAALIQQRQALSDSILGGAFGGTALQNLQNVKNSIQSPTGRTYKY